MIDTKLLELGAVILTGLDSAIIGRSHLGTIVYSYEKVLHYFEKRGWTREESIEFVDFNVLPLTGQGAGFVLCYESNLTGGIDTSLRPGDFIDTKNN